MSQKKPNKFIAPIVIAGVTVGFLSCSYKFVFAKPKSEDKQKSGQQTTSQSEDKKDTDQSEHD